MVTSEFLQQLVASLDPRARQEFGQLERIVLLRHMALCGMEEYPALVGPEAGERAGGDVICDLCKQPYLLHPMDWRVIGYGDVPFLNVLCDGRRVKL